MAWIAWSFFSAVAREPVADPTAAAREQMVKKTIEARGIADERVLAAMRKVPRHRFVPESQASNAYVDDPLPIGHGQTISQPYIVAFMTEAAQVEPGERVLEIGTGSGYQAAVLAEMGADVYTIEIVEPVALFGKKNLEEAGYSVHLEIGDGYAGWPDAAPFGAILVTAAPDHVPQPLKDQLAVGGRLVVPVGGEHEIQYLTVLEKQADGTMSEAKVMPVRFVPMTGEAQRRR